MRNTIIVTGAVAALSLGLVTPALASTTANTTTTFILTGGALSITAPASAALGTGPTGGTIIGPTALGNVTVTDARGLLVATWTAVVSSTNFITGGGSGPETVPATDATYLAGVVTPTGVIVPVGSAVFSMSNTPQTAVLGTVGVGNNSATWDPTVTVTVPSTNVAGTYTATITHSVS